MYPNATEETKEPAWQAVWKNPVMVPARCPPVSEETAKMLGS